MALTISDRGSYALSKSLSLMPVSELRSLCHRHRNQRRAQGRQHGWGNPHKTLRICSPGSRRSSRCCAPPPRDNQQHGWCNHQCSRNLRTFAPTRD